MGVGRVTRVSFLDNVAQEACYRPRGKGFPRSKVIEQVVLGQPICVLNIVFECPGRAQWVKASILQERQNPDGDYQVTD